jgi:2-methylisocitrate lyase-like PEP mutase family enzyme
MSDQFRAFQALHVPGDPVILYNAWDVGSAKAVAGAGAKAIATGSWSVAAAQGFEDGEALPLEFALASAARIAGAVSLPVTIDFEGGYAIEAEAVAANFARLQQTGAIGCNFEDRVVEGDGLHTLKAQSARIRAAREAVGEAFFINARTDIFLEATPDSHDDAKADAAIERGLAYAEAGASGFFIPGLVDLTLMERICAAVSLPVNFMAFPGAPDTHAVADAGIARVSYGPNPYRGAMAALAVAAQEAFAWRFPAAEAPPARPRKPASRPAPRRGRR